MAKRLRLYCKIREGGGAFSAMCAVVNGDEERGEGGVEEEKKGKGDGVDDGWAAIATLEKLKISKATHFNILQYSTTD